MKIIADMHTHSENSHDSVCLIEDMCLAQIEKGINVMAVTDHGDIYSYDDYDIYTPIKMAYKTVKKLNEKYEDKILLLSGVEISEGFWYPQYSKKMRELCNYDVIIGSVHCVKYKELILPYSKIDFSELTENEVYEYLDAYFNDVLTILDVEDFDILAHLTCPLRYITGKYKIEIDLEKFEEKINKILNTIIEKDIALEVNTSSYNVLNDFMPTREIIKKYFCLGGRLITIGSDAHITQNASINFEKAIEFIKETGFEFLCYYKERKPIRYEIFK